MKIGIAINGEGRGHFSRARAIAEVLKERYEIAFWVPAHLGDELAACFPESEIHTIPYLKFVQKGFSVDYLKTASVNAALVLFPHRIHSRIARQLRDSGIETVVSDFEPFTSKAAKALGIPVLQLNHPGVVTRFFSLSPHNLVSQLVSRYMMANADRTIFCSFFGGDIGPIIRSELRSKRVTRGDYFVVYQKPMYREFLEPVLESAGREKFRVFPDPHADYADALAGCCGLIAPAGHQSISEALALGKPVFAIPVDGQYEQMLNARKLRESGFGDFARYEEIAAELPRFMDTLQRFENAIAKNRMGGYRNKAEKKGDSPRLWSCQDETLRAAYMVENFIFESRVRPEWHRKTLAGAILPELY